MYKTCNTEESVLRQQQLEDCLLKNMLQKSYGEISVSDLCEQAAISRKSFYRYFGNKDGCLCALLDRVLINASKYESPMDRGCHSPEMFHALAYWKSQKALLDALTANGLTTKLLDRSVHHMTHEDKDTMRWLGIKDVEHDMETLLFTIAGYITVLFYWNEHGYPKSVQEMTNVMNRLMFAPLMDMNQKG